MEFLCLEEGLTLVISEKKEAHGDAERSGVRECKGRGWALDRLTEKAPIEMLARIQLSVLNLTIAMLAKLGAQRLSSRPRRVSGGERAERHCPA